MDHSTPIEGAITGGPAYNEKTFSPTGRLMVWSKGGGDVPPPPAPPPKIGQAAHRIDKSPSAAPSRRRGRNATILTSGLNTGTDSDRVRTILGG